jgi:DNA-binding NarL/FixJ family response regulator
MQFEHDGRITRIAIQDRQRLFREGLDMVLGGEPDLSVVCTASTAGELVTATARQPVDLVLLELDASDWDPCRLVAALCKRHPGLAVVGTVAGSEARATARAYQAGVRSVFARDAGVRALLQTIRSLPSPTHSAVWNRVVDLEERRPVLSAREVEVLGVIGTGATTRSAAEVMGISPKTVENHKQRIFSKLGVQNQAHAVAVALRHGLLTPAGPARPGRTMA